MRLTDHDLRQLDEAGLDGLAGAALRELSKRWLADLNTRMTAQAVRQALIDEKGWTPA